MKSFISFHDHRARFLETEDLLKCKSRRVISARELDDGDLEIWLQGSDKKGSFFGMVKWSDIRRKPLSAAWLQPDDYSTVMDLLLRRRRAGGRA